MVLVKSKIVTVSEALKSAIFAPQGTTISKCLDYLRAVFLSRQKEADGNVSNTTDDLSQPRLSANALEPEERENGEVTLVLVDVQPPFLAACKDPYLIASIVRQVELAVRCGWAIVLIEAKPWAYGATTEVVTDLLKGKYERFNSCSKEGDDGSLAVLDSCRRLGYPDRFFRVAGVLVGACVKKTAWGLANGQPACLVRVIKEACGTNGDTNTAWTDFEIGPRVVVSSQSLEPALCIVDRFCTL